jgi:PAS domain S-box-containing protein
LFLNHASEKFFGVKPKECIGMSAFKFIHPDDVENTKNAFEEWINSNNNVHHYENRQLSISGEILIVAWIMHLKRVNDKVVKVTSIGRDITASKKVQLELQISNQKIQTTLDLYRKSEQSYKEVVETTSDLISVVDNHGNFMFVNHASEKFFGVTPKECVGEAGYKFIHPDDVEDTKKAFEEWINSNNDIHYFENRQVSITGDIIDVSWVVHLSRENNKVVKITSIGRDITVSKKVQLELQVSNRKIQAALDLFKKSEQSYREVVETTADLINIVDSEGKFTFLNYASINFLGLSPKECLGKSAFEFIHPDDVEDTKKAFEKWMNSSNDFFRFENRQVSTTGNILNVAWRMHVERVNGKVVKITSIGRDVTESVIANQKIQTTLDLYRKSEQSYKEVVETTSDLIIVVDNPGNIIFINHSSLKFFGLSPKECKGKPAYNFIHPDDVEITRIAYEKWKDSESDMYHFENRQISVTGDVLDVSWIVHLKRENNIVVQATSIGRDVTEQKKIEKELALKKDKLQELNNALNEAQRLSRVGSWQWNMITDEAEWSDEMYNIYGVTKDNFYPSNKNVNKTVLPEDLHKIEQGINSLLTDR